MLRNNVSDHLTSGCLSACAVSPSRDQLPQQPHAHWLTTTCRCGAVAAARCGDRDPTHLRCGEQEISILKSISYDRNIVQFYGAVLSGSEPMLVLEYMEVRAPHQAVSLFGKKIGLYLKPGGPIG